MIFSAPAAASIVAPSPATPSSSFPFSFFFSTPVLVETVTEMQVRDSSADSLSACCCDRLPNSVCAYQQQLGGVFLVPDESFLREEDLGLRCDDDEEHKSQKTTTMVTKITATALTVITVQSFSPNTFVVRESSRTICLSIPISPVFTQGNKTLQH
jgi:hypothetical protein